MTDKTLSDDILEDIWKPARNELECDFVGLWELISYVRGRLPELDDSQVQGAVLAVVDRALRRHEAAAGLGAIPGGLENVWSEPVDQIIERIRHEWNVLGRDPKPGEIVWLDKPRLDTRAQAQVVGKPTMTYTQRNGSQVFVQRHGDRYTVVMQREHRVPGSWEDISEETLNRLVRNFGWRSN